MYQGRKDSRIKLRGQRLELGEVEEHFCRVFPNAVEVIAEVASVKQGKSKELAAFIYQDNWEANLESSTPSSTQDSAIGGLLYPACLTICLTFPLTLLPTSHYYELILFAIYPLISTDF